MKIAYVLPVNVQRFGYTLENFLLTHHSVATAREVAKKGHDVELHAFWNEDAQHMEDGLRIYFYKTDLNVLFGRDFSEMSLRLLKRQFDADVIVHFHEPLRLFFVPFMLTHHNVTISEHHGSGISNPFSRRSPFRLVSAAVRVTIFKRLLNTCSAHIVHNGEAKESFFAFVRDKQSIFQSPNGISAENYAVYDKDEVRRELGLRDELVILFAGRVCVEKCIRELVHAFEAVRAQHSNIRLVLAGPLQDESLRSLVEKYWVGYQNPQGLQKWLTASDIFCLPSIREAFGIVLAEALYYSLPVIASDVRGIREWFPHEKAIFVPPKDTEGIANAIRELLDGERRREMSKDSRQLVLDNYTWEKVCQAYIELYRTAARREGHPHAN